MPATTKSTEAEDRLKLVLGRLTKLSSLNDAEISDDQREQLDSFKAIVASLSGVAAPPPIPPRTAPMRAVATPWPQTRAPPKRTAVAACQTVAADTTETSPAKKKKAATRASKEARKEGKAAAAAAAAAAVAVTSIGDTADASVTAPAPAVSETGEQAKLLTAAAVDAGDVVVEVKELSVATPPTPLIKRRIFSIVDVATFSILCLIIGFLIGWFANN
jgi:hypothetical protein